MKHVVFKTIIISDVHLGTEHCRIREVNHFLKQTRCERLILNGDIIDGWQLQRSGRWTKEETRFLRLILKKAEKQDTEVVYLRGNHDDFLARLLPFRFDRISLQEDYILQTAAGRRYLIFHGDVLDAVTTRLGFISKLGDVGYQFLLQFNRLYNRFRAWRGKEYFSLSREIKARVKAAVSYISRFEGNLRPLANSRDCGGAICGHIHTPADRRKGDFHYMNSGDWVESLTAIVEHLDGRLELITYEEFCRRWNRHLPDEKEDSMADDDLWLLEEEPVNRLAGHGQEAGFW